MIGLVMMWAIAYTLTAQPSHEAVKVAENTPIDTKIAWKTTKHDFGTIAQNAPVSFVFELTNVGDEVLILDNVRTTCGCTAPEWPKEPIAPKASSQITVTYNAAKAGAFKKLVKVYLKGQKKPEILTIEGTVATDEG